MYNLAYNITPDEVFNGHSEVRNRVVAHIFKELGLIEQWGSGINRIITACVEQGLQTPKIAEQNDFFDVEIIRPRPITTDYDRLVDDKPSDTVGLPSENAPAANDYERLTNEKKVILLFLLERNSISRKEATELIGLKNTKTYEILTELVHDNLIQKNGQGRTITRKEGEK